MNLQRAVLFGTGLAGLVAGGASAFSAFEVAGAAFAATLLGAVAWLVLWARRVGGQLAAVQGAVQQTRRRQLRHDKQLARLLERSGEQAKSTRALDRKATALDKQGYQTLVTVQRTPSVTVELGRVYDRLVDHQRPMPELGDWAMTASTMIHIIDQIASTELVTIVECGSGSSTIWFATALERRGGEGRVVALESSAEYAELTRAELARLGLAHRAQVLHAPLVTTSIEGRADQPWFDHSVLPADLPAIDLLFVDGPVGSIAPEARYPALPLLADRLAEGAEVILDDTGRPHEKRIVQQWLKETHGGQRLEISRRLDRAVAFRAVRAS